MARVSAVLLMAAGLLFSFVHALAGDPHSPEGPLQHLSLGLPILTAGAVALIGIASRSPWLMIAGGVAALPMCMVSIIGLPAVVCAAVVIAAGARSLTRTSARDLAAATSIVTLLVSGFFYEVLHQDPASWVTADGSAGSSNVITPAESVIVLLVVGVALIVAFGYARRVSDPPAVRAGSAVAPPGVRFR
jgi:hypothetical protein